MVVEKGLVQAVATDIACGDLVEYIELVCLVVEKACLENDFGIVWVDCVSDGFVEMC